VDASIIGPIASAVVAIVAVVIAALWIVKRLRQAKLVVRLDESTSLEQLSPLPAGYYYSVRLRFFVSNVGMAAARDVSVWLRFDMDHLVPLMSVGSEPTTVDDFEVSRVDVASVHLHSVSIPPRNFEPAITEVPVEVRRTGPTEISYRVTCQNCAALFEGILSFTASEAKPEELRGSPERPEMLTETLGKPKRADTSSPATEAPQGETSRPSWWRRMFGG
jgi:hypothetical protein